MAARRRPKPRRRRRVLSGPRPHSQRPFECCATHRAVRRHELACWDCVTLELADSRAGWAILLGYRSVGVINGVARPVPSVLDCLIEAEEIMGQTEFSTRAGYRQAVGL